LFPASKRINPPARSSRVNQAYPLDRHAWRPNFLNSAFYFARSIVSPSRWSGQADAPPTTRVAFRPRYLQSTGCRPTSAGAPAETDRDTTPEEVAAAPYPSLVPRLWHLGLGLSRTRGELRPSRRPSLAHPPLPCQPLSRVGTGPAYSTRPTDSRAGSESRRELQITDSKPKRSPSGPPRLCMWVDEARHKPPGGTAGF